MSTWSNIKVPLFASGVSLVLGGVLVMGFGGRSTSTTPTVKGEAAKAAAAPAVISPAGASLPVAALEARIAALETKTAPAAPAEPNREPDPVPERPTAEEESRQTIAARDAQQRAFDAEGYDPAWSPGARNEFKRDLAALAQDKNYKVVGVDCKTTLCKATVEWPSYGEVRNTVSDLLYADYRNNCTKQIFAPVPGNQADPYQGTVIYDCTASRTNQ